MNDLIDRQAALDALGERPVVWSDNDDYTLGERNQYDMDRLAIETVPSAQQEYEQIPAGDVALKSTSNVFKSPMWWFDVLKEIEKAGFVICKKMI